MSANFLDPLRDSQKRALFDVLPTAGLDATDFVLDVPDRGDSPIPGNAVTGHRIVYKPNPAYRLALLTSYSDAVICRCSPGIDGVSIVTESTASAFGGLPKMWSAILETAKKWAEQLAIEIGAITPGLKPQPDRIRVLEVKNQTPWTAHITLAAMLSELQGQIRICDPFYGHGSLVRLAELSHCNPVQFLSRRPENSSTFPKLVEGFLREHPMIQIREFIPKEFHDRFILSADALILVGHGLKDIGNADSFIVRLDQSIAGDLMEDLAETFDRRWVMATAVT